MFQQGKVAIESRNYSQAESIYRQAIQLYPNNAVTYYKLGNALYNQKKLEEAVENYRRAIQLDPNYAAAYHDLGIVLYSQKKLDEAIANYHRAIQLDPNSAITYVSLGNVLDDQKKSEEAIANYRRAIQLDPNSVYAYFNMGVALSRENNIEEAIASYRRAIQLDPNYAVAYNGLGNALIQQGKLDEALINYRRAIQLDPNLGAAYNGLGVALRQQGKLDEALINYRRAIQLDPNNANAYIGLGNALSDQKKLDEAIASYRQALRLPEDTTTTPASVHTSAHNNLGLVLQQQGKIEEAIAEFKQSITLDPNFVYAQNNLKEAERLLALRRNPQSIIVDDRQWLPSREKNPLVDIYRSVVWISADIPAGRNTGAGWVVKREGNKVWIITNRHVVSDAEGTRQPSENIEIEFYSEPPNGQFRRRYKAQLSKITNPDDSLDLAVLEVTGIPDDIKPLQMYSGIVSNTTLVRVIGHPNNGRYWSQVRGEISNVNPNETTLQIDANLAQGNSGGPVIDLENRVVVGVMVQITDGNQALDAADTNRDQPPTTGGFGFAYRIDVVMEKLRNWGILK
nr:serine protease [Argonema galeatum]